MRSIGSLAAILNIIVSPGHRDKQFGNTLTSFLSCKVLILNIFSLSDKIVFIAEYNINKVGNYLSHFKVGRGLPCLEMQVSSRISPSLKVTVGNPVIVGASGGPSNIIFSVAKATLESLMSVS